MRRDKSRGSIRAFTTDTSVRDRLSRRSSFMDLEDNSRILSYGGVWRPTVDSSDPLLAAP